MSNYWVIKGNPDYYNWDAGLRPGHVETWGTRYEEKKMTPGDRVFLWESGGRSRVVGFATVVSIDGFKRGKWRFSVRYLAERLDYVPSISELRAEPKLRGATFLKPGVFRTVYPVDRQQASAIYRAVVSANPNSDVWRDLFHARKVVDPELAAAVKEGRRQLVTHFRAERDPSLPRAKKAEFRRAHGGRLFCECCGHDFIEYGALREGVFEVHHRKRLGKAQKAVRTSTKDLAVLCANCHRAIHRTDPMLTVERFRVRVAPAKPTRP